MPTTIYRVRYTFAGASGVFEVCSTRLEAEMAAQRCHEHFFGLANVWIEEREVE